MKERERIFWTIAIFVALSFFAVMVLRKHEEPKIIGEISPDDVSDVSKAVVNFERDSTKSAINFYLKRGEFRRLAHDVLGYSLSKITSVEALDSDDVVVRWGTASSKSQTEYSLEREGSCWKVTSTAIRAGH